ncbi:MAG: cytidylyltransferase domain-containing protein [Candidatus Marinarcus sp.]|uniref:acylneuraminate cytidylyltransferase family protein n=1 Tax=Candidatus Marinarcus sp. TaxID=3100987 RepID=UPI003B00DB46
MKILSVIPARGGSKGLPRKNIVDLLGKPLMAWSIEASLRSKYITKTVVSSEDDEILEIAKEFGAETLKRDAKLASDEAKTEPVILDVVKKLDETFDYIVLLQATSPLRTAKHIDEAFEQMFQNNAKALISVYEPDHSPLKAFVTDENNCLKGIVNDEYPFFPRQLLPKTYYPNGAIYIVDTKMFLAHERLFIEGQTSFYLMDKKMSKDIDTFSDLEEITNDFQSERKN